MSCTPPLRTIRSETKVVFSRGAGGTLGASDPWILSPDELIQIAPLLVQARVTIIVDHASGATGDCVTQAVLQATDDGMTWDTAVGMETAAAGNRTFTTNWYSTVANFKRGIRFGVIVSQGNAVTIVQSCQVTIIIDLQLKS
jgi:hypothetical protein